MNYFITALFGLAISCFINEMDYNGETVSNGKTVLYDKLTKPAAILVWYDKFYDEHSIKPCGTFNLKKFGSKRELAISEPTLFILPIGVQVPYLIYPADTVVFYDKGKDTPPRAGNPTLKHQRLMIRTNELKFFEDVYDSLGACYGGHSYAVPGEIQTYMEILSFQKNKLQSRLSFLNRRYDQNRISSKFYEYAKGYFLNKFYDDVFTLFSNKKYFDSLNEGNILFIADSLISEFSNEQSNFNYAWYESISSYVELRIRNKKIDQENFDSCVIDIVSKLKGSEKNYAVFYFYKYLLNNRKLNFLSSKLDILKQVCTDQDYIEYISGNTSFIKKEESVNKAINIKTSDIIFDVDKAQKSLTNIIDSLKNKVIYIDFWASWCVPCVEELPFSKKLISSFKDKDVAFVFLSLDTYSTSWLNAIKRNDIGKSGLQYLIVDIKNNYFINKYNVGPIPRYILIDKTGKVFDPDAPRPSEQKTSILINQLLKE